MLLVVVHDGGLDVVPADGDVRHQDRDDRYGGQRDSETIKVEEASQSRGSQGSWSRSLRNVKRELMTPDEIGRLPDDECLYLLRGCRPFRSHKLPIYTADLAPVE